jgi:putative ABC transport system permease protein
MLDINLRLALKALTRNRLQALLTLCGMSVGVAMVVVVSGLGRGAQLRIENQIESAGPTLITVKAGNYRPAAIATSGQQDSSGGEPPEGMLGSADAWYGDDDNLAVTAASEARTRAQAPKMDKYRTPADPLDEGELLLLTDAIDNVRAVAGSLAGNVTLDPGSALTARIARVAGFQEVWPGIRGWTLLQGRLPSAREHRAGAPVAVVSDVVAQRLWGELSPLEQQLPMGGQQVRVIGVIRDALGDGSSIVVPTVHLPMSLAQHLLGRSTYDEIIVRSRSVANTTQVAKDIQLALRELHALPEDTMDDFRVETQSISAMPSQGMDPRLARAVHSNVVEFEQASWEEMAKSLRQAGRTFTLLLAAAASVSLLVGGIGVMNIMLVSVAARTREIGLRMALGARMGDVLVQFLVEAVVLAALGGVLGLLLGGLGLLLAREGFNWATAVSPTMLVLAVGMATLTGVIFGYGPARRAAQLDPVIALKSE